MEETILDVAPNEDIIIDTFEYSRYADGLPDHLINISGLIYGLGNQPKPFLTSVIANMYIEGFVENFAVALGLEDDHLSRMNGVQSPWGKGRENTVVAALLCPIAIDIVKDPYCSTQSSKEEDCNDSN